jgi:hypothetical protein
MPQSPATRRYSRDFLVAMVLYAMVIIPAFHVLKGTEAPWLRILLALLPTLPTLLAARAQLRFIRDCDELQRRIQLEAFALASLFLTLGAFALGLLALAGVVRLDAGLALVLVLPAFVLLYGVCAAITGYRYQ